jgi:hypothetical protein
MNANLPVEIATKNSNMHGDEQTNFCKSRYIMLVFASIILTGACWAFASPPGSSFDESYHIANIWCAKGLVSNECERDPNKDELQSTVLTPFVSDYCYQLGDGSYITPATCENLDNRGALVPHRWWTGDKDQRNIFYLTMSVFTLEDARRSIPLMRIVNTFVFAGLIALAMALLSPTTRRAALWGVTATLIPQGVFLIASINPSGWAYTAVALNWAFLLELTRTSSRLRKLLLSGCVIVTLALATSRLEAPLYILFSSLVILSYQIPKKLQDLKKVFVLVFVPMFLAALLFRELIFNQIIDLINMFQNPEGIDFILYWLIHWVDIPALSFGSNYEDFGPLGGGEILLPSIVPTVQLSVLMIILYSTYYKFSKKIIAFHIVSFLFLFSVLIPQLINEMTYTPFWVQGRYILPILPFILGFGIYQTHEKINSAVANPIKVIFFLLGIAHSITLLTVLIRYTHGSVIDIQPRPSQIFELNTWSYVTWLPSSMLWIFGSISYFLFLYGIYKSTVVRQGHKFI